MGRGEKRNKTAADDFHQEKEDIGVNGRLLRVPGTEKVKLKKNLGLLSGTAMIVGTMIGSGIFVSPKGVLIGSGSVGMSFVVWGTCGLLATLGALCYAELGTAIPKSGGEHAYLKHTFGRFGRFIGPIPAFLYDWLGILIIRPSMFAIMVLSFGTYASEPFFRSCQAPPTVKKLIAVVVMLFITFVNCFSVKVSYRIQNFFTAAKLIAAAIIAVGGIYSLAKGNTETLLEGFEDTQRDPAILALSFYNGLWAYDGWNNLNFVVEELKNPYRNLPLSILIGIPLTTAVYLLVNIGYFAVLSKEEVLLSHAVALTWSERMLGVMAWIMPILVVMSCFGAANGSIFASGRLVQSAAMDGHFPKTLSYIQMRKLTPTLSLMLTAMIGILMIFLGDLGILIEFFNFTAWIFYGLTAASTIILRFTDKDLERPYKVSIIIPILVVLASVYLVFVPIVINPRVEFLYALIFLFSGLLFYVPLVYLKYKPPLLGTLSKYIQIILLIVPPERN